MTVAPSDFLGLPHGAPLFRTLLTPAISTTTPWASNLPINHGAELPSPLRGQAGITKAVNTAPPR